MTLRLGARSLAVMIVATTMTASYAATCPKPDADGHVTFDDGSILMSTRLAVNPDGAAGSYAPGDHGYTYVANGVNLIEKGKKVPCSDSEQLRCRKAWLEAEAKDFGQGTAEFCVFAMDVVAIEGERIECEGEGSGRYTVGNGKGRPKKGPPIKAFGGGEATPYVSTTTLRHTVGGQAVYTDSAALPGLVAPRARKDLIGAIVWVRHGKNEGFAIVNDTGPRFGEGSVALHELLRRGSIGPTQPLGPIPTALRCSPEELALQKPFVSSADLTGDRCRTGVAPRGPADIRAKENLPDGVVSLILPKARPPMKEVKPPRAPTLATIELTAKGLSKIAEDAGYTEPKLREMAACLPRT